MDLVFENNIGDKQIVSKKKENYLFMLLVPTIGTFITFMISIVKRQAKNVILNYFIYSFTFSFILSAIIVILTSNKGITDPEQIFTIIENHATTLVIYNAFVAGLFAILYSPYLNILRVRTLVKKKYVLKDNTEENQKYVKECVEMKMPFYILIK